MERLNKTVNISQLFNPELLTSPKIGDKEPLTIAGVRELCKDIPLTEEEEANGLLATYKNKAYEMEEQEKQLRKQQQKEAILKMWSYNECYQYALDCGKVIGEQCGFEFKIDYDNGQVFKMLALYFCNDPRFETEEFVSEEGVLLGESLSLRKGICLLSPIRGNGKTTLLDCFMHNKRGCFLKISTKKMARAYERDGIAGIEKELWLVGCSDHAGNFFQTHKGFHYDDFGDEKEVVAYGTRTQISSMIINSIYDEHRNENMFWRFHVSMNYKWSEYELKYGSNTYSRMKEMFNLIKVPGESRRK
jgi:hypothetical protein